jgi:long-chain acyl-CoA synthetase
MNIHQIHELAQHWAEVSPEQLAIADETGSWNYKQLEEAVKRAAYSLSDLGVRSGQRVVLMGENSRMFVALLLGLTKLGAWVVLANPRIAAGELDQIREHSKARVALFVTTNSVQTAKHSKRCGPGTMTIGFDEPVEVSPAQEWIETESQQPDAGERIAVVIYTSGTTGTPKGVMLSHGNLLFMASRSAAVRCVSKVDRILGLLPVTHAVGLAVTTLGTLYAGATLIFRRRFDPRELLDCLEQEAITIWMGSPSMFGITCDYAAMREMQRVRLPALRVMTASGAPLQLDTKLRAEELFGLSLHNGYGVTECSPTIALTRPERPRSDTSVGEVFPEVEIRIVGPSGEAVPDGDVGELHVRGPNVMKGYFRAPTETREVIDDEGWFNTRDLAKVVAGNLFLVGRSKELIVRFGFNVYPAEVEAVLNGFPGVLRSAVIGQPTSGTGDEDVVAFIEMRTDVRPGIEEVRKYASERLAPYKVPSRIVWSCLPVGPTGKVQKAELLKTLG